MESLFWGGSIGSSCIKNVRWDAKRGLSKTKYRIKYKVFFAQYLSKIDKNMIIIPFSGGLGNQLFQYAFSKALIRYNTSHKIYYTDYLIRRDFAHNGYELNNLFGIETTSNFFINYLTRVCRKLLLFTKTKEVIFFFSDFFGFISVRKSYIFHTTLLL